MKYFKWIAHLKNKIKTNTNTSEEASPKKVTDEVLNRSVWTSLVSILLCMLCLVGLTWAWFTSTVENSNQIQAATLELGIQVKESDGTPLNKKEAGYYALDIDASHHVTITGTGDAEKVFCQVLVYKDNSATCYYTDEIPRNPAGSGSPGKYSFTIGSGYDKVKIIPLWGEMITGTKIVNDGSIDPPATQVTAPTPDTEMPLAELNKTTPENQIENSSENESEALSVESSNSEETPTKEESNPETDKTEGE